MSSLKNHFVMMKSEPAQNLMIILVLLCYPSLMLTVRGGMGILFFLLLLASIVSLYRTRNSLSTPHWDKYSIVFTLSMASPILAIFLSQAYHGQFKAAPYDWASRFLLSVPIFLALRQTNIRTITILQIGIPLGTLITAITLYFHHVDWGGEKYSTAEYFHIIYFADVALILGFLSLFSLNWGSRDHALILIFKFCGFLAGVYMAIQSGERGSWVAIPPLLLLWVISYYSGRLWLKLSIAVMIITCVALISYKTVDLIHYRIDSIFDDLSNFIHGNQDTSLGIRLQQWRAAFFLFWENPLFGVAPGGFLQAMPALNQAGVLTTVAAQMGTAQIHSEIFAKAAETGIFGLLSLLSIYIVPTAIFWQTAQTSTPQARRASFMGVCLVAGFFIFGLTVEIFNLKMTASFFALTLAVLLAAATNKTSQQESSSHV